MQQNPEALPSEDYLNMIQVLVANHQRYFDARQKLDDLKTDLSVIKPSLSEAFTLKCPNCNLPCSTIIALLSNPSYLDDYNPDAANECQAISCPQCNTEFCMFCNKSFGNIWFFE